MCSRALPTIEGDDRLMNKVEQQTDNPPPDCPVCRTPAVHWGSHDGHGVTIGNYLCANEHGWLTKWVTP